MTLFRPPVVSEYQKGKVSSMRVKWQAFRIFTWIATLGVGASVVFGQEWPGTTDSGDHALKGIRRAFNETYENMILGGSSSKKGSSSSAGAGNDASQPPPPSPPTAGGKMQ